MSIKNLAPLLFVSASCLIATPLLGECLVNQNLGELPMGSRVHAQNSINNNDFAQYHVLATKKNTILPTNTDRFGNWGREYVYQFQIDQPARISLQLTTEGTTADFDFVLLSGLSTVNEFEDNSGKFIAVDGLEFTTLDPRIVVDGIMDTSTSGTMVGDSGIDYTSFLDDPNGKYLFRVTSGTYVGQEADILEAHVGYVTIDPPGFLDPGADYEILNLLPKSNLDGLDPGTYYLAAEVWDGFDGDVVDDNGPFSLRITRSTPDMFDFELEFGDIATSGDPLTLDTFGSGFDTKMALYGEFDTSTDTLRDLIAVNDDAMGTTGSLLSFPNGLNSGKYFIVVGGSDTVFTEGFSGYPSTQAGTYKIRHSRGMNLTPRQLESTTVAGSLIRGVQMSEFVVVNPPPYSIFNYPDLDPANPNPSPVIDVGTVASGLEPMAISSLGSGMPDTELALFDSSGMFISTNDDVTPPTAAYDYNCKGFLGGDPNSECRSLVDLPRGLHPGTYYAVLTGFDKQFDHGFSSEIPDDFQDSFGGGWTFNHPGGSISGSYLDNGEQWFRFNVGPNGPAAEIVEITNFQRPTTDIAVVTWKSDPDSTYRLETSIDADFWVPVEEAIPADGSPATTTTKVLANVIENHRYFRVREDRFAPPTP